MPDEFDYAPAWRPAPDGVLRGTVTELTRGTSDYGTYPIITIKATEDNALVLDDKPNVVKGSEYAVHCMHQALKDKVMDLRPEVGSTIAIKYFGEVQSQNGRQTYHKYVVRTDQKQQNFWPEPEPLKPTTTSAVTGQDIPDQAVSSTPTADEEIPF